jgi:hypothetical protein
VGAEAVARTEGTLMKRSAYIAAVVICVFALGSYRASAASDNLTAWFVKATAYTTQGRTTNMAKPDPLPGTPSGMACRYQDGRPNFNGGWQLLSYDRTHHIAFAAATTDQCSVALFRASAPAVAVPDADLSAYSTRLGIHIGSTYASVRSIYGGGPVKSASHFVVQYSSNVPGETVTHKKIQLPQVVTIVVDAQRVSSISIYTDLSGEF